MLHSLSKKTKKLGSASTDKVIPKLNSIWIPYERFLVLTESKSIDKVRFNCPTSSQPTKDTLKQKNPNVQ